MPVEPQPDGEIIAAGGESDYLRKLARALGTPGNIAGPVAVGGILTVVGSNLIATGLPTSDPAVVGALYVSAGAIKISAGP